MPRSDVIVMAENLTFRADRDPMFVDEHGNGWVPIARFMELHDALTRAHEQLGKHDYKGPKQIGRAMTIIEDALGIDHNAFSTNQLNDEEA